VFSRANNFATPRIGGNLLTDDYVPSRICRIDRWRALMADGP